MTGSGANLSPSILFVSLCAMVGSCSDGQSSPAVVPPSAVAGNAGAATSSGGEGGAGGAQPPGLRDAAARANRLLGTAVDANALRNDATYADLLAREFDYATPENATKWGFLAPTPTTYAWADADAIVAFAEAHSQRVKGHVLVWHKQAPAWVNDAMTADELQAALQNHIETTLAHFRGRIRAWDVVNEAIDTSTASGFTESIFWQKLGPSYIENAFRWARAADPEVLLYYNDFAIERLGNRSDRVYALLEDLLGRGVPIDGIGFQSHSSTLRYASEASFRANVRRFAALGLAVNISELDVRTVQVPGDQATRWQAERVVFQQFVGVCATEPGCDAVTLWGFADQYSWINQETVPDDPLVFDRAYGKKPAYDGVLAGLGGTLPVVGDNLVLDGDFQAGGSWVPVGGELAVGPALERAGQAGCVSGRTDPTHGLTQNLLEALRGGGQLSFSAWVRVVGASSASVRASLAIQEEGAEPRELVFGSIAANDTAYVELTGDVGLGFAAPAASIELKFDGPPAGVDLCVADVKLGLVSVP
jgi:GH35 family endo-1,4-beta-xylanase